MTKAHFGQHDDGCFACKIQSIAIGTARDMPTRVGPSGGVWKDDKDLSRDRDAFKSLREQGIQPASLKGAADLASRADTVHEIQSGKLIGDAKLAQKVETTLKDVSA